MTDELGGQYIKEFVSNGAKTYAYETNTGEQVVKCKGFTLNKLASDQLTLDAMRHMATSYNENVISFKVNQHTIRSEAKKRRVCSEVETKIYRCTFDKRVRHRDNTSTPYGYTCRFVYK